MIRTESELRKAVQQREQHDESLKRQREEFLSEGLTEGEAERALAPLRTFRQGLVEEIESFERLRAGDLKEVETYEGLGKQLVALRIARGMTQRELAERIGIHESQVSRDERHEYHGVTLERASRILQAYGVKMTPTYEVAEAS